MALVIPPKLSCGFGKTPVAAADGLKLYGPRSDG
jgi:hypothetical protein